MNKISIVMPVKNAVPFLDDCMASIIDQTFEDWELIAVNDHSTDATNSILEKWSHVDRRIKVFQNDRHGIVAALQKASKYITGDMVTRMDADDKMASKKLMLLHEALVNAGSGNVAVGLVKYISDGSLGDGYIRYEAWLNNLTQGGDNFREIYKECVIPSPCWMLYYSDFQKCGAFESEVYPEDYDLCFRMRAAGLGVASVEEVVHYWRDYPERTSRNSEHYADNRFLDLKCKWFLTLDYNKEQELYLWGAGKKGKEIAKKLIEKKLDFRWITGNEKKQGVNIYGNNLVPAPKRFPPSAQVLLAVANPAEQNSIIRLLMSCQLRMGTGIIPFC